MPFSTNVPLSSDEPALSWFDRRVLQVAALIGAILFLPSMMSFVFNTSSHATGAILASVIVVGMFGASIPIARIFYLLLPISLVLLVHLLVAGLIVPVEFARPVASLLILGSLLAAAACLAPWFQSLPNDVLDRALNILRITMIVIGIASILGLEPRSLNAWAKPAFPFTEPSHFALAFTPLLVHGCVRYNGWPRYGLLLITLVFAYRMQNLTLIVAAGLAAAVSLPIIALVGAFFALLAVVSVLDIEYFTSRLDFDVRTTKNLSTLIYLQGTELAEDAMRRSYGWGIGFQQLGYGEWHSFAANRIFQMIQAELNIKDGGFVAAKLIAELGVIGVGIVIAFAIKAGRAALKLRQVATGMVSAQAVALFPLAVITGYSIDMFVRGVGYFGGTTILVLAALLFDHAARNRQAAAEAA